MDNPCYNRQTKTDCSDRHAGCAAGCSRWATHCEKRNEQYEKINKERAIENAIKRNAIAGGDRAKRHSIRTRVNNRRHGD